MACGGHLSCDCTDFPCLMEAKWLKAVSLAEMLKPRRPCDCQTETNSVKRGTQNITPSQLQDPRGESQTAPQTTLGTKRSLYAKFLSLKSLTLYMVAPPSIFVDLKKKKLRKTGVEKKGTKYPGLLMETETQHYVFTEM